MTNRTIEDWVIPPESAAEFVANREDVLETDSADVNDTRRGVDWPMKIDDARCHLKSVSPKIGR